MERGLCMNEGPPSLIPVWKGVFHFKKDGFPTTWLPSPVIISLRDRPGLILFVACPLRVAGGLLPNKSPITYYDRRSFLIYCTSTLTVCRLVLVEAVCTFAYQGLGASMASGISVPVLSWELGLAPSSTGKCTKNNNRVG